MFTGSRSSRRTPKRPGTSLSTPFPEGLHVPVAAHGVELCRTVTQRNAEQDVTWVHPYVSDDKRAHILRPRRPFPKGNPRGRRARGAAGRPDYPGTGYSYMRGVHDAQIIKSHNPKVPATTGRLISTNDVAGLSLGGGSGLAEAGVRSSCCCRNAHVRAGGRGAAAQLASERPGSFLQRQVERRPDRPCHRIGGVEPLWQGAGHRLG